MPGDISNSSRPKRNDTTTPSSNEVELWTGSLKVASERLRDLANLLSVEEKLRADRFRFAADSARFVAGRAFLRLVLGQRTCRSPASLVFEYNAFGKPSLPGPAPFFNVAHSVDRIAIALAERPVGVDLEMVRPIPEIEQLTDQVFSEPEQRAWRSLAHGIKTEKFLALWTRKEAIMKAIGAGITQHLQEVSVFFDNGSPIILPSALDSESWSIQTQQDPGMISSVALRSSSQRIVRHELEA